MLVYLIKGDTMSYDLYLHAPGTSEPCELKEKHQMRGGTYQIGGCPRAEFNITWNYADHYYRLFGEKGIRTIYGMTGAESIPVLTNVILQLGQDEDSNYWKGTEGNAKKALRCLLSLATECPDGIWDGD